MNISVIWYTVQDLYDTLSTNRRPLQLYQFNTYAQMVDSDILRELLRIKTNPSSDVEDNNEQVDLLQKFKKFTSVNSATAVSLPSGYIRFVAAYDGTVKVDFVSVEEYTDRIGNSLTAPSTTYPVCYLTNGTIVTDPITIGTYTFWYYGENTGAAKPSLALKKEAGITKYDSSASVQFVWPEYMYPKIVMMILKYLGISINDPAMVQEKLREIADGTT